MQNTCEGAHQSGNYSEFLFHENFNNFLEIVSFQIFIEVDSWQQS